MFNLNEEKYNPLPTEDELLKIIPSYEIFKFYLQQDISLGKLIKSPIRDLKDEDIHPSFSLYQYNKNPNIILYGDFGTGERGNAIQFVSKLFKISIMDAISKILEDISIRGNPGYTLETETKNPVEIRIKSREWTQYDIEYWKSFGVTLNTLKLFNCKPVLYYFINERVFKADKYSYSFPEYKDNRWTYKIYQPFNDKEYKFVNNHPSSVHQGYRLLPDSGEVLLITKSYKDVMCLRDSFNMLSVGVQGEYVVMKSQVVEEYKSRFKRQYTFFDNDSAGKRLAGIYENLFGIRPLFIPDKYQAKDISDYYKLYGTKKINFSKL